MPDASVSPPETPTKVDILIVDDNLHNVVALEAMLEELGENIVRAESGKQALRHLLERDFALVLLDIQMPELDGFETAQIIRARARSRQLPIIFLTAFGKDDEQLFQGYKLGAVDFLFKPIVPFILRSKVKAFVDLHRKTLEVERQAALLLEIEHREHDRGLADAAQRWEAERLREEMIQERSVAATLVRTVADSERAEAALQASHRRLTVLAEVADRLLLGDNPQDFLENIHARVSARLHVEVFLNFVALEDGKTLTLGGCSGIDPEPREVLAREGEPVARAVAASGSRMIAERVQRSDSASLAVARDLGLDAYACFPVIAQGRLFGTLSFGTRRRPVFEPDDIPVMQAVCDRVAIGLERARLVAELSLRNSELANAHRRKDEFLAMLAHELRNPMAPIVTAVQLLRTPGASRELVARTLDTLDRQSKHLVRLVDDLVDLSRITTGKVDLRREHVTLAAILTHAIETSAPVMAQGEHLFHSSLPDREIALHGDVMRLGQVIANLLNNAAKYSPPGSKIALEAERHGNEVVIRVRDEGIGIGPESLGEVFGLFAQFDRKTERAQGGLGIGLTLVKNLVEMHGGSVSVRSAGLGKGSEFAVRLPIVDQPAALAQPPTDSRTMGAKGSAYRVVLVEDNEDIGVIMKDMLDFWGHETTIANDGPSGVEAVLSLRPDVALIDIGLPGLDGYQVVAALLARAPHLATRLIALTGYGSPRDRDRALAAGFDQHVVKPVTSSELLKLIEPRAAR